MNDKTELLVALGEFKATLLKLRAGVRRLNTERVSVADLRGLADEVATTWVEKLRSPLEHRFKIDRSTLASTAAQMKRLHKLSQPNNRRSSYLGLLKEILLRFDDKFTIPVKQMPGTAEKVVDLTKLVPRLPSPEQSDYLREAIECAAAGHARAAIVLGWCCVIDRLQQKVVSMGLQKFSDTSRDMKSRATGKYKRWNKEFSISNLAELQSVFDSDLLAVVECMGLLDDNQTRRLEVCFLYRCQSAHPGHAPIAEHHVVAFFNDIVDMILANDLFDP